MFDWLYSKASDKQYIEATKIITQSGITKKLRELCRQNLEVGLEYLSVKDEVDGTRNLVEELSRIFSSKRKDLIRKTASALYVNADQLYKISGEVEVAASGALVASVFHRGAISPSPIDKRFASACETLQTILEHE